MDEAQADAYLARIGAVRPAAPTTEALADLTRRHLMTVPFENLSIHLGEPIELTEAALLAKIVDRRRGGFCYELNGALGMLLTHLGYDVTLLAARVFNDDTAGPLFDHLALRVACDGDWLVDVGFGKFVEAPVRLDVREPQADRAGEVLVAETAEGDLDVALAGARELRIEQRPRVLDDFVPTCWFQQTSPASHFTRNVTCSLPTSYGRITLAHRLLITTVDGQRTERVLTDDEVLPAYAEHFGLVLDRIPDAPRQS
ncbi:MAG: acetyltransferase [Nocardioidaceae bacterium]|nr:acetyltransferase [Nocardioidaceae bacterium]